MVGGSDAIGVRTKHDKEEEEQDRKLMERIFQENKNPFQLFADPILNKASYIYDTYLYSAGVLFVLMTFWSCYPSFVRFRHQHIWRYRRTQLTFRRGLFGTPHIPKWDKKYLQRIVIPPLPKTAIEFEAAAAHATATPTPAQDVAAAGSSPAAAAAAVAVMKPTEAAVSVRDKDTDALYQATEMRSRRSPHSTFSSGDAEKSELALTRELQKINKDFYGSKSDLFNSSIRADAEDGDLQSRLKAAVASAKAVVVLKESHDTLRSVPEGWEVWWVSFSEAKRRRFCKFWLGGLLCARVFEDLMEMPDMPDLVN
ncbi:putative mitochondrial hypothetical protein [Leptomonas pyrrhocoris]|uniref:Uncharacterized protein n=1 Tax=Leptomonas pyrrhocoris TaxID=157538 RepID=A0A0N0DYS2_LEPPY|nr:putative mitochondrial hypothetical protein [Leptomonas pyrrhocoris]KPA84485.1 putative mitochondrial hypothetical protein [Leptomonas pyrrhocoris]|eukprot:XP_015662924.1 putative mitochondrial hypothetical protein [Leptomonas pyrrhocoris]